MQSRVQPRIRRRPFQIHGFRSARKQGIAGHPASGSAVPATRVLPYRLPPAGLKSRAFLLSNEFQQEGEGRWVSIDDVRFEFIPLSNVSFEHAIIQQGGGRPDSPHQTSIVETPPPTWILAVILPRAPKIENLVPRVHSRPRIEPPLDRRFPR